MPFEFKKLEVPDVVLIHPRAFGDERGFFMESYRSTDFHAFGIYDNFQQDNHSKSVAKGTLRGLHFQREPKAQAKIVRVVRGSVFDVAVDIRPDSPSFGKWVSAILTAENKAMLYIPKGFAHGVCTLEDNTEILYKSSGIYSPEHEGGIMWNDPELGIAWPVENPVLSDRDTKWPTLHEYRKGCRPKSEI